MLSRAATASSPILRASVSSSALRLASAAAVHAGRTSRSGLQARRNFLTIVQQGHEGWRLTFGRSPVKLDPGLRVYIPFYHDIQIVDIRETSVKIEDLTGFTSDNVPVTVSGSLFFRVHDSYAACFGVHDFQGSVTNIGTSAMRSVVGHFTYDEVIGDRNRINTKLHEIIGNGIEKWGVKCTRFEIQNFKPLNREIEKQLELQMAAERERRKQVLDTQALVNVAEGHKQRSILESEGARTSQLNAAEAEKLRSVLTSEGLRIAAENEGKALATQVEIIAASLANDGKPTGEGRVRALDAILQLRRLEQLKAIASGQSNSTYFFGDRASEGNSYEVDNAEKWKGSLRERTRRDDAVSS